ncbi:MAG: DNA-binding protein [Treponema sp.]|jgi:excisionase family DNA binding protein|nr:DNA-binding protein [Treponema sp.]
MTTNIQPAKEVMSRAAAAAYIGIGKSTLDRLDIPKIQIRRRVLFKKEAIDQWLLSQQTKTTTGTKA